MLVQIFREMLENFEPILFHLGGSEISIPCWNSSEEIRNYMTNTSLDPTIESDFYTLWGRNQEEVESIFERLNVTDKRFILWSSTLTQQPHLTRHLDNNRHFIQWWGASNDPAIQQIVQNNFRLILSNYDRFFLVNILILNYEL